MQIHVKKMKGANQFDYIYTFRLVQFALEKNMNYHFTFVEALWLFDFIMWIKK